MYGGQGSRRARVGQMVIHGFCSSQGAMSQVAEIYGYVCDRLISGREVETLTIKIVDLADNCDPPLGSLEEKRKVEQSGPELIFSLFCIIDPFEG